MRKQATVYLIMAMAVSLSARASSTREDDIHRIEDSAEIFQEMLAAPDKAVPQELLESAECLAVIPSELKFAFFVGGNYGKGLVTCRSTKGWSAPLFITVGGGSLGFQIGGSSTDYILVFRGRRGLQRLLRDRFKIGGDVSGAAGPVGRSAAAGTDIALHAEILTYSRSRGAFAGVSLSGAVVQADDNGNQALYGSEANKESILEGKVPVPPEANVLMVAVSKATRTPLPANPAPATPGTKTQ